MEKEKIKIESLKHALRTKCYMAHFYTKDKWYDEKYKELEPPKPKIISKEEVRAEMRKIKRLEKKLSTKK